MWLRVSRADRVLQKRHRDRISWAGSRARLHQQLYQHLYHLQGRNSPDPQTTKTNRASSHGPTGDFSSFTGRWKTQKPRTVKSVPWKPFEFYFYIELGSFYSDGNDNTSWWKQASLVFSQHFSYDTFTLFTLYATLFHTFHLLNPEI